MYFGPFELQTCGENDFTTKTLGLLAFRPDLRERLVRHLLGDDAVEPGAPVSILFFSRIGENFFREAIEREYISGGGNLEARCNAALHLPLDFRWRRNADGRITQPAKWQSSKRSDHFEEMLIANGRAGDVELRAQLEFFQDCVNTEPDVVLQWGGRLALIEIKVFSGQGVRQLDRQRELARLLAGLTGLDSVDLFLIGPGHGGRPDDPLCRFVSWEGLADWFDDVPEIATYIREFTFFYKGSWRSMVSEWATAAGVTAWDLMLATPSLETPVPVFDTATVGLELSGGAATASRPFMTDSAGNGGDDRNVWSFEHLGQEYFARIVDGCRRNGIWPLLTIWTGVMGVPYATKAEGRRVNPNWMVEDAAGERHTRGGGFRKPHAYDPANMRKWSFEQIAAHFGFPTD